MITANNLTSGFAQATQQSYNTASISPAAYRLILLSVVSRTDFNTTPQIPTVSGNGLTWELVDVVEFDNSGSSRRQISLFRTMGSSPTSGAVTIDFGSEAQGTCIWAITEFDGVDTSGTNGSGAIVQHNTNFPPNNTVSTLTITLDAFSNENNATFSNFGESDSNHTITPGSGFSQLHFVPNTSGSSLLYTQWKNETDTTADISSSGVFQGGGVAVEIAAQAGDEEGLTVKIKLAGTFVEKPLKTKIAGTFTEKPILVKSGGSF